ncbi:MAG: P1 family peptidase [Bacillota bacterium]|nr:P1 family peptidase [Bacillota bacterium]
MYSGWITDIEGLKIGHSTNDQAMTGCTVVLCEEGAVGGVEVRGGAPGTRETDLLRAGCLVEKIHAVVLAGGSAFGLDAACGVMHFLEGKGVGFDTAGFKVPIVCAAVLFDLSTGDGRVRPDAAMGYEACFAAKSGPAEQGRVGAGAGATVGKALGPTYAMYGGIGMASISLQCGAKVAAVMAVNALGDVIDYQTGSILAGAIDNTTGKFLDSREILKSSCAWKMVGGNTVIGVVATDAKLGSAQANRLAAMGQNGLALSIRPAHTLMDGDTVFALATGRVEADIHAVFAAAQEAAAMAIANAVSCV